MNSRELTTSRWLEAYVDRSAGLRTLPRNAVLADVTGDGSYRLVLTDINLEYYSQSRLKSYNGTQLVSDEILHDVPNSLITFYCDELEPRIPAIGVACGSDLFMYKNLKPFYKFRVPSCPLTSVESEAWKKVLDEKQVQVGTFLETLKSVPYHSLSSRSQYLLNLPSDLKTEEFVNKYMNSLPTKDNTITCTTTLRKTSHNKHDLSCPVVATEFGNVYVLDPQNFSILQQANVCSIETTPFIMKSAGAYEIEYKIVIATREGHVCILKREWLEGKSIINWKNDIVDMELIPGDNLIVIACNDKTLNCFTKRGHRLWSIVMTNSITCLCVVDILHLNTQLLAVGVKSGPIHVYSSRHVVDYVSVPDTPSVLAFGHLGQEENVMTIITSDGSIIFKILKRTAEFKVRNQESNQTTQGTLSLPKRSKLFLEQTARERQHAVEIHQMFQQDLLTFRLTVAKAICQAFTDQSSTGNQKEQIKLSAQVLGLGPKFTVVLSLENINPENHVKGVFVTFHVNPSLYKLSRHFVEIPLIPPGLSYKIETRVIEIVDAQLQDQIQDNTGLLNKKMLKVFVARIGQSQPILAATINMPPTEFIV
ncbi:Bardet-Biedl syndrome 1 protein homolog [Cylas formicarius]|uniref:Bardet-Biedl syndrome 1 protein homolog n=1 Tax=Cylas formicarius TaxID=197179 RepID=UPI002958D92E|nr:Bardet-Biedl syndrome 1 protein homolog [Cylas formicarius]